MRAMLHIMVRVALRTMASVLSVGRRLTITTTPSLFSLSSKVNHLSFSPAHVLFASDTQQMSLVRGGAGGEGRSIIYLWRRLESPHRPVVAGCNLVTLRFLRSHVQGYFGAEGSACQPPRIAFTIPQTDDNGRHIRVD